MNQFPSKASRSFLQLWPTHSLLAAYAFETEHLIRDAANVVGVSKVLRVWQKTKRFLASEDGPTAVEYAVILALIVGVCLASIHALASATGSSFDKSGAAISKI